MSNGASQNDLLLIGAEPEMLELLEEILSDSGFGVVAVSDASEIERRLGEPQFDTVVCDELAGELDGLMIFDALVESAPSPRPSFILLSDVPDGDRIATCLKRDMDEYVVKPFDITELIARIERVIKNVTKIREAQARADLAAAEAEAAAEAAAAEARAAAEAQLAAQEAQKAEEEIGFSGSLSYMNLPDLLMNLHQNGQTGELQVTVGDGDYVFAFMRGELVNTKGPRGLKNRKAFYRAMRELAGSFKFVPMDEVTGRRSSAFENVANVILQAVQEADEFPLTRRKLPPDPVPVSLTVKVEETPVPENSAIQPLLEGLIKATTIDILIHACPKTDLEAARELEELMMAEVLVQAEGSAAAAS